jgi:hypothetical protein
MAEFPVPLDNLIVFVRSLQPEGQPLDHLADAASVSAQLDEQADALLGHFVDQARRSGASWTQIGGSLGVTKQAARKRFVPRWDGTDLVPPDQLYSRFTPRAQHTLAAAGRIAEQDGSAEISPAHLAAGLLFAPGGLAARVMHGAGLSDEQIFAALALPLPPGREEAGPGSPVPDLSHLRYAEDAQGALRATLTTAVRLGHNYIGTEHLLLGILADENPASTALVSLGLTTEVARTALLAELAKIQAMLPGQSRGKAQPGGAEG